MIILSEIHEDLQVVLNKTANLKKPSLKYTYVTIPKDIQRHASPLFCGLFKNISLFDLSQHILGTYSLENSAWILE